MVIKCPLLEDVFKALIGGGTLSCLTSKSLKSLNRSQISKSNGAESYAPLSPCGLGEVFATSSLLVGLSESWSLTLGWCIWSWYWYLPAASFHIFHPRLAALFSSAEITWKFWSGWGPVHTGFWLVLNKPFLPNNFLILSWKFKNLGLMGQQE